MKLSKLRRIWSLFHRKEATKPAALKRRKQVPSRGRSLSAESLEGRWSPAVITVTGVGDTIAVDGVVTLREAITAANTNLASGDAAAGDVGLDTINFNIAGGGVHTIAPTSFLPNLTEAVFINGYSQSGSSVNTLATGDNAILLIEISGANAGNSHGMVLSAGGTTIQGLIINGFNGSLNAFAILAQGTGNTITGNFIGTNAAGSVALANANGISINSAVNNTIGGAAAAARNVISGNGGNGIRLVGNGNLVAGNYIGVNAQGTQALANGGNGIAIDANGIINNTIGGTAAGAGNVISGNAAAGIFIAGTGSNNNLVQGNLIGTDATGTVDLGNGSSGIIIASEASFNTIGGSTAAARNVVSGNGFIGVFIQGAGSSGNVIQGNFIGVDVTGIVALGNTETGVAITDGDNNVVGGSGAGEGNVISGNSSGISLDTLGNSVVGNFIGTDLTGTVNLKNNNGGMVINGSNNAITGNTIAFNGSFGILGQSGALGNAISQNSIFGNGSLGIDLLPGFGVNANDVGDGDGGANLLQNYPALLSADHFVDHTNVHFTFNSTANATFRVEFFSNVAADNSFFGEGQTFLGFLAVVTNGSGDADVTTTLATVVPIGQFLTATATDAGNNTSEFSNAVLVQPSEAPPAPSTPDLTAATDTGLGSTDDVTDLSQPTFSGTAEGASTVRLFEGVNFLGSGVADGLGQWTITLDNALTPGVHSIVANAQNIIGTSANSAALSVTVNAATKGPFVFTDTDGDIVTVSLKGAGTLAVSLLGAPNGGINTIFANGTDLTSSLTVKVKKVADGLVNIGAIQSDVLKSLSAKAGNLVGSGINLSGLLKTLTIHDILNGADVIAGGANTDKTKITAHDIGDGTQIAVDSIIKVLTVARFGKGEIDAPSIGTLNIKGDSKLGISGDFAANTFLSSSGVLAGKRTLNNVKVKGLYHDAVITVNLGTIGTMKFGSVVTVAPLNPCIITAKAIASLLNIETGFSLKNPTAPQTNEGAFVIVIVP